MQEDRILDYQQTSLKFLQLFFPDENIIEKVDKFINTAIYSATADLLKESSEEDKKEVRHLVLEKQDDKGYQHFLEEKFGKQKIRETLHENILKAFDNFVAGVSLSDEMRKEADSIRADFAEIFSPVEEKNDLTSTPESLQNAVETPEDATEPSATL